MDLKMVKGIGEKTLFHLNENDIHTVNDLISRLPRKYITYQIGDINLLEDSKICIKATVCSKVFLKKINKKTEVIIFYIMHENKKIKALVFGQSFLRFKLKDEMNIIIFGTYKAQNKEILVQNIFFDDFELRTDVIYGLKNITDLTFSRIVANALMNEINVLETLPNSLILKYKLLNINDFIRISHNPKNVFDINQVYRRKKYEEYFNYLMQIEAFKYSKNLISKNPKIINENEINDFISNLEFDLTTDQLIVVNEVINDLKNTKIMNRLIQGDVSCGKTIVSFISALAVINAGFQVALMAPTEILASQHMKNALKYFSKYNFVIELLTSNTKKQDREEIYDRILHGRVNFIIGTHSLLEDKLLFRNLGLVIIDEQQRFGVNQRKKLIQKCNNVDSLFLSATPIPRSLGLTEFGDLDLSSIKTLPQNRKKTKTNLISFDEIKEMMEFISKKIANNEQIYVVCPLIEENETMNYLDLDSCKELFSDYFSDNQIAILHGKLKNNEKNAIMNEFINKEKVILISTTVIEVGVDVKDASVMIIFNAEAFGLSQIHQLRGRVGRGNMEGYCFLVSNVKDNERLKILVQCDDGFTLSNEDLKLRGPGDFFGTEQSGYKEGFDLNSSWDMKIYECAKNDCVELFEKYKNKENLIEDELKIIKKYNIENNKIN